jgi:hypothetical protein
VEITGGSNNSPDCRKEACWALSNLTSGGSNEQIAFLVNAGGPRALTAFAKSVGPEGDVVRVAVEGLANMLENLKHAEAGTPQQAAFNALVGQVAEANGAEVFEQVAQGHFDGSTCARARRIVEALETSEEEVPGNVVDANNIIQN